MTTRPPAAVDVARRLWVRGIGTATDPDEVAAASDRLLTQLRLDLGRWIGADGYRGLVGRAREAALAEHRALAGVHCLGGEVPATKLVIETHGVGDLAAGIVTLVTVLIELLGRIIGEDMAVRLVEQTSVPGVRKGAAVAASGGTNG
ncbi:MAG: hypothetical protein ABI587_09640 [Gemmatimonadales bacterium]